MTPHEVAVRLVNDARAQLDHAERSLFEALRHRQQGHIGRKAAECGTPSGYNRHRRDDDPPCPACMTAHSWYDRHRKRGAA